ncbi:MAG TPA: cysteine hydrolase family protein [Pyrinomonadaceae bacterium]|nr:cysteine hydrolase family protein [Pyrinomonadaceae bacterium]
MKKDTALLVVDVQSGVVDWSNPDCEGERVLKRINNLLSRARRAQTPVIYIQHDSGAGGLLEAGTPAWQIHPAIFPADGELVIRKRAADSFYETPLKSELDARGIRHLVVVGCRTQYCVDTTCRQATSLGYDVTLAGDAHTTMSVGGLSAAQIIAHHNETLEDFGNDNHVVNVKASDEIDF